jgi:hypothetical protein
LFRSTLISAALARLHDILGVASLVMTTKNKGKSRFLVRRDGLGMNE